MLPSGLVEDFRKAGSEGELFDEKPKIEHESLEAPHEKPSFKGKPAVYVFSLCGTYRENCSANPHRVLKVGQVGPQSGARFRYQHYNPDSAGSTLAGQLLSSKILWPYLGIKELSKEDVGAWILENTDRNHFYLSDDQGELRHELEKYIKGRVGPVFEG